LPNAASINTARSQPASLTRRVSNVVRMDVLGLRHKSRGSGSQRTTIVPCTPWLQTCIPVRVAPCNGRDGGNGPDRKHVADKVPVQPERQPPIRQTEHGESPATGVRHDSGSSAQPVRISCWRGIAARTPVLHHLLAGKVACTYQTTAQIAHTCGSETCRHTGAHTATPAAGWCYHVPDTAHMSPISHASTMHAIMKLQLTQVRMPGRSSSVPTAGGTAGGGSSADVSGARDAANAMAT